MIRVDHLEKGRWDAMRDAVVVDGRPELVVTRAALEAWAGRPIESSEGPALLAADASLFVRAARATPADDGTVTLTARIMASRSWAVDAHAD